MDVYISDPSTGVNDLKGSHWPSFSCRPSLWPALPRWSRVDSALGSQGFDAPRINPCVSRFSNSIPIFPQAWTLLFQTWLSLSPHRIQVDLASLVRGVQRNEAGSKHKKTCYRRFWTGIMCVYRCFCDLFFVCRCVYMYTHVYIYIHIYIYMYIYI